MTGHLQHSFVKKTFHRENEPLILCRADGEKTPIAKLPANCPPRKKIPNEQRIARTSQEKEKKRTHPKQNLHNRDQAEKRPKIIETEHLPRNRPNGLSPIR
jgi:hypothetical protein